MRPIPAPPLVECREFLASTRWFRPLDERGLDEILAAFEWVFVAGGEEVYRAGDAADGLYLVWSGRLAAVTPPDQGEERIVREAARGETVGEIAVLTGQPRTATVLALRDSELAKLPSAAAEAIFQRHPAALLELARTIAGWVRASPQLNRDDSSTSFAVVSPAGAPGSALSSFSQHLSSALAAFGPTIYVNAARVDAELGKGVAAAPEGSELEGLIPEWVHTVERTHRFVLYEAEPGDTPWTRRCLRQADRFLVVVEARADPGLGALAAALSRIRRDRAPVREELILLHPDSSRRPTDTARWLALRRFGAHHHVRLDRPADWARLARLLSGRAVGLVLGGGGARGLAHIGVLRALEEAGVAVDRFGGTSMGAVIAAQRARGYGWQEMVELNRMGWVEMAPQKVLTLPIISILSPVKAEVMLQRMYGDDFIEDLWESFFCVSTNMSRAQVVVHRNGSLRFAIGASMTIPGVTPPKVGPGGDLLADGGVLNNLPIDVMRHLGTGPIVAADVSTPIDVRADPSYREAPSPWRVLRQKLRRSHRAPPFPNILQLIHRAALMASDVYAQQAKADVDLYLDLPMEGFEMFEMEALDRLVEHGYQETARLLHAAPPEVRQRLGLGIRSGGAAPG